MQVLAILEYFKPLLDLYPEWVLGGLFVLGYVLINAVTGIIYAFFKTIRSIWGKQDPPPPPPPTNSDED